MKYPHEGAHLHTHLCHCHAQYTFKVTCVAYSGPIGVRKVGCQSLGRHFDWHQQGIPVCQGCVCVCVHVLVYMLYAVHMLSVCVYYCMCDKVSGRESIDVIHILRCSKKSPSSLFSFLFHGDGKAIGQHKKPIYDTPKLSVDSLPPSYKTEDPPPVATSSGYHSQTNLITSPATNYGSPFVRSETLPPTIHADQHPDRLGRQVSATWDINPVVPRRSVSQPTPAPAGAYTYHTPRSSCGAHGGGDEYELMIHPASMNRLLYNASDYVYMHSTQSPAKYSNYDFVPPASSLSTISEVERPTPYENHTLPQELSCQSK